MIRYILSILLVLCALFATAQTPGIISITKYGGSGTEHFTKITRLNNGSFVACGSTNSLDGDGTGNHGDNDFFLVCVSPKGQLLWKKVIGGSGNDGESYAGNNEYVSPTADGGFYFGGVTSSSDGDIPANAGGTDAYIAKFDALGNIIWGNTYGSTSSETLSALETTPDGGCIFVGSTYISSNQDIWVEKLDASGAVQWSKTWGGTKPDYGTSIKPTADGGYIFTADIASADGDLTGTMDPAAYRANDIWIVKTDATGNIIWNKRMGGSNDDDDANVIQSISGDFYVLAESRSGNGDFPHNTGLYDIYLVKLSASGNLIYTKGYSGLGWDSPGGIVETADGNLLIGGISYSDQVEGHSLPPFVSYNECQTFAMKVAGNTGNLQWLAGFKGSQRDFIRSVCLSQESEMLLAGQSASTDGDFPNNPGDAFIIKLAPFNAIKGNVYFDTNGNNIKEADELYATNVKVTTTKQNSYTLSSFTDGNGVYNNEVDSGTFKTAVRLFNKTYYKSTPDSFSNTFNSYYGSVTQDIALTPVPGQKDLQTHILPLTPARPGRTVTYRIASYNAGTEAATTGTVTFLKDKKTAFVSASPAPASVSGDTITWNYNSFNPLDTLAFDLTLQVDQFNITLAPIWIYSRAVITPDSTDLTPRDNHYNLYHLVTGAYDPNDKHESHGGNYTLKNLNNKDFLDYTIRFQNTGTDTAFQIVVKDTLDSKVDVSSFELVATSHPGALSIENNICTWTFNNILLPDSNRNEAASHGYIAYRVKPAASVNVNNKILNSASIYFDYNDPVKTNIDTVLIKQPTAPATSQLQMETTYCSKQLPVQIKIKNYPDISTGATVVVTIDHKNIAIVGDSSIILDPATLAPGSHQITLNFTWEGDSVVTTGNFMILADITPVVDLSASVTNNKAGNATVMLLATMMAGGNTNLYPFKYTFAKDRNFTDIFRGADTNHIASIDPLSLSVGTNTLYVKVSSGNPCASVNTAIDSVVVTLINKLPIPSFSMYATYCANQTAQTIKLLNVPAYIVVTASIDDTNTTIVADSSIVMNPSKTAIGEHHLKVTYNNGITSTVYEHAFIINESITPVVDLTASVQTITDGTIPVILTATKVAGNGTITYTFAKDRNFSSIIGSTVMPASLKVGDNKLYVKMATDDGCAPVNTSMDSVSVNRSVITGINEPDNSIPIVIAPNPFSSYFTISGINPAKTIYLEVYDASGRLKISKRTIGQTTLQIDASTLENVNYLLIMDDKNKLGTIKLLKK